MTAIAVVDEGRRQFLIRATSTMALAGAVTTAVPFLSYLWPTAAARLASLPVIIDLTKISPGEGIKLLWRGTPIWVIRRPAAMVEQFASLRDKLKDPDSLESEQPTYANNPLRARRADVMVLTAVCTHLQCIPDLKAAGDAELGNDLNGGFFCACHGSRYDAAGRVMKGSPAPTNLPVPAYYFENDTALVIGVDASPA